MRIEEVFYHRGRLCRVFAFAGTVECHASVGIGTAGYQVVEEGDVAGCGYLVKVFQGVVIALSGSPAAIGAFCVGLVDVDTVVEKPVDVFAELA